MNTKNTFMREIKDYVKRKVAYLKAKHILESSDGPKFDIGRDFEREHRVYEYNPKHFPASIAYDALKWYVENSNNLKSLIKLSDGRRHLLPEKLAKLSCRAVETVVTLNDYLKVDGTRSYHPEEIAKFFRESGAGISYADSAFLYSERLREEETEIINLKPGTSEMTKIIHPAFYSNPQFRALAAIARGNMILTFAAIDFTSRVSASAEEQGISVMEYATRQALKELDKKDLVRFYYPNITPELRTQILSELEKVVRDNSG